jgi:hypothetical protein
MRQAPQVRQITFNYLHPSRRSLRPYGIPYQRKYQPAVQTNASDYPDQPAKTLGQAEA